MESANSFNFYNNRYITHEIFNMDYNSYNPYTEQYEKINVNSLSYNKTHENNIYSFPDIETYIKFQENYVNFQLCEKSGNYNFATLIALSMNVSQCNKDLINIKQDILYIDIKVPAAYQYVYFNIKNDADYLLNKRNVIKKHIFQYKHMRGLYKNVSKCVLLNLLGFSDNIIYNYKI